jgi:hypothetical protein
MKRIAIFLLIFLLFVFSGLFCDGGESANPLINKLKTIPGLSIIKILKPNLHFKQIIQLSITQPLDHQNPNAGTFQQTIFLSHVDQTAPTLFVPDGYGAYKNRVFELTAILKCNQVYAGHRFYYGSSPEKINWPLLTQKQAAADYHRIITALKPIYTGKWLSGSISKGGLECLFHRRHFPTDVTATIAYVAPAALSPHDPRLEEFILNTAGTPEARRAITTFQRAVLKKRRHIFPIIKKMCEKSGKTFPITYNQMLEYHVLEYPFSYWQYSDGDTTKIPAPHSSPQELHNHLLTILGPYTWYTNAAIKRRYPNVYESYTQIGYYRTITAHLKDLLKSVPPNPSDKDFAPPNIPLHFDSQPMKDLLQWIKTKGTRIICLYGSRDPWTACAVTLDPKNDTILHIAPNQNHSLRLKKLPQPVQSRILQRINSW